MKAKRKRIETDEEVEHGKRKKRYGGREGEEGEGREEASLIASL